jgi:HEAT repeat protein
MVRLAHDEPSIPLKDREGTISTPFRKIFAIICLSPVFLVRTYATNTNDSLRRCAIATLGQIGAPSDLPLIRAGLTDPNRSVQMAAEAAVKRIESR